MVGQWSWMPKLCILISVHKICIADGLPDPYREPRTQNLPPKAHQCDTSVLIAAGHRISVTTLGDFCNSGLCARIAGTSASLPPGIPSSVAVDYFWIVSVCCHGAGYRLHQMAAPA